MPLGLINLSEAILSQYIFAFGLPIPKVDFHQQKTSQKNWPFPMLTPLKLYSILYMPAYWKPSGGQPEDLGWRVLLMKSLFLKS